MKLKIHIPRAAFLVTLLALSAAPLLAQSPAPTPGDRPKAEAQLKLTVARLARDKDLAVAREGFEKAHQLDPTYPKPLLYLGEIAFRQENWAEAITQYQAFIALDNTSDDYVQAQLKLDEARKNQQIDSTKEGKRQRQAAAAREAAKAQAARAQQDIDDAARQLAAYDQQIADALTQYQPTSQHVAELRKQRDDYYQQVSPRLLEILDAREKELAAMAAELLPTAPPRIAKQAEVDQLRRLCKSTLIPKLLAAARAQETSDPKAALEAANEALSLDPGNSEARKLLVSLMSNSVGMKFVPIPAGQFMMGSPADENGRFDDEAQHKVRITRPFFMSATPVTQAQWKAVMGNDPSNFKGDDLPVEQVSWDDAVAFCNKLSQKEGKKYRLPTEAEWEYACRAGTMTAYYTGNDESALAEAGWYSGNSDNQTHPVGQKKPNAWGLYDMHGNVLQWCNDWYDSNYYSQSPRDDPPGPEKPSENNPCRVRRGGSWGIFPRRCRSAFRINISPDPRGNRVGFRVVLDSQ